MLRMEGRSSSEFENHVDRPPRRRVLLIAMVDSPHVARWLEMFEGCDITFVLFPSGPNRRVHATIARLARYSDAPLHVVLPWYAGLPSAFLSAVDLIFGNRVKGRFLRRMLRSQAYDFIHVMEIQHAGYALLRALGNSECPAPLITSAWGSDINWFVQFPNHKNRIRALLVRSQYFAVECERDREVARRLGFVGEDLPGDPIAGGIDLSQLAGRARRIPPSSRKRILVKGYHRFMGRGFEALRAVEECAERLEGYEVVIYSAGWRMRREARKVSGRTGLSITTYKPHSLGREVMLDLFLTSRLYMGLSLSDGISVSMIEAMATGVLSDSDLYLLRKRMVSRWDIGEPGSPPFGKCCDRPPYLRPRERWGRRCGGG